MEFLWKMYWNVLFVKIKCKASLKENVYVCSGGLEVAKFEENILFGICSSLYIEYAGLQIFACF